ncbi:hypothetical protein F8M41_016193 [Gigaspora margarita]|uniref:Uncharacterized protein n=1 Tax=Gigaspora margarita TaxID=4874 RepID=A0A8H4EN25_GIGMA|nr:hypothetical protein F8M41_016193 [Gigaspora margarita]
MSKRTSSGEIKANSQVDSSDLQEKSSTPQVKELTVHELIVLKNWELANYIADKAYPQLIIKLEERHEFMNYLKEFYELQVTEYEKIEREVLPKNCSDNKKLYTDAQLYSPNDSDTQSQSSTISSEIDQLNQESENNQLELEYSQSHETNHQTKITDLSHKDKHEVIVEMNK